MDAHRDGEKVASRFRDKYLDFLTNLVLILLTGSVATLSLDRILRWQPDSGDASVWFAVYEWVTRGERLYEEVWDHKDAGFLGINSLAYGFGGVSGVYLLSGVFLAGWTWAIYSWLRCSISRKPALTLSLFASVCYVSLDSFLSVYTEHYAISLAVMALAVVRRSSLLSGFIFAAAVSIKVGAAGLALIVFTFLVLQSFRRKRKVDFQNLASFVIGLSSGLAIVFFANLVMGSPSGWVDVIFYNVEYSQLRNPNGPLLTAYLYWLQFVNSGLIVPGLALCLIVASGSLGILTAIRSESRKSQKETIDDYSLVAALFGLASVLILSTQYPLSFHHFQFAAGGVIFGVFVNLPWLVKVFGREQVSLPRLLVFAILVTSFSAPNSPAQFQQLGDFDLTREFRALERLRTPASSDVTLSMPRSVAVFGGNSPTFDPRILPESVALSCRFIYQFPHLVTRYGPEIDGCISRSVPELVLWDTATLGQISESEDFLTASREILRKEYEACEVTFGPYSTFVRPPLTCIDLGV